MTKHPRRVTVDLTHDAARIIELRGRNKSRTLNRIIERYNAMCLSLVVGIDWAAVADALQGVTPSPPEAAVLVVEQATGQRLTAPQAIAVVDAVERYWARRR